MNGFIQRVAGWFLAEAVLHAVPMGLMDWSSEHPVAQPGGKKRSWPSSTDATTL